MVFIVDDDAPALKDLEALMKSVRLRTELYLSAEDFFRNYDRSRPGCLLLAHLLPGMGGIGAFRQLRQNGDGIPVIFLARHGTIAAAVRAMREGAFDFLEKPPEPEYLIDQIQAAICLDRQNRLQEAQREEIAMRLKHLSRREIEVIDGLMAGQTSKAIARELGVAVKTVDFHRANIMRKIRVETIAELVHVIIKGGYARENRLSGTPRGSLAAV
jgi:FixJ family two-component response regulator